MIVNDDDDGGGGGSAIGGHKVSYFGSGGGRHKIRGEKIG